MKYIKTFAQYVPRFAIGIIMIYMAIVTVSGNPDALQSFEHFGLPLWVMGLSGAMLFAGGILLMQWQNKKLQEYAHVGFLIYFLGAFMAHIGIGDPVEAGIPALAFLALTLASLGQNHLSEGKK